MPIFRSGFCKVRLLRIPWRLHWECSVWTFSQQKICVPVWCRWISAPSTQGQLFKCDQKLPPENGRRSWSLPGLKGNGLTNQRSVGCMQGDSTDRWWRHSTYRRWPRWTGNYDDVRSGVKFLINNNQLLGWNQFLMKVWEISITEMQQPCHLNFSHKGGNTLGLSWRPRATLIKVSDVQSKYE